MSTIVFCIWPYISAMNSSLKLAKTLKDQGHRVCFLGIPDCRDRVISNGLEYIPIYERWFPRGSLFEDEIQFLKHNVIRQTILRIRRTNSHLSLAQSLINRSNKEFYDVLATINPDLLILGSGDIFPSFIAIMAHQMNVPCVYITIDLIALPQFKVRRRQHAGRAAVAARVANIKRRILELLRTQIDWERVTEELAIAYEFPRERLDLNPHFPCPVKLHHLVLVPKEFDLPQIQNEGDCFYAEASIDLSRDEASFPWHKLNDEKPLIYCSLGTMFPLGKHKTRTFFQFVIDAAAEKEKYQVVISVGTFLSLDEFSAVPSNVIIVNQAPQLSLLRKAEMMITSAGISTVKECILSGVPMIVFPFSTNAQMSVATRINFHKLGVISNFERVSADLIVKLIEKVEVDQEISRKVEKMSRIFRALEKSERAMSFLEAVLK